MNILQKSVKSFIKWPTIGLCGSNNKRKFSENSTLISLQEPKSYKMADLFKSIFNPNIDAPEYIGNIKINLVEGKGRGIVANQNFKAGDLISVTKASIMNIENTQQYNGEISDILVNFFHKIHQTYQEKTFLLNSIYQLFDGKNQTEEVDLSELIIKAQSQKEAEYSYERVNEIVKYNSFSAYYLWRPHDIICDHIDERLGSPNDFGIGLWILPSFYNHSCVPNANELIVGDLMFVRAVEEIKKDEEICIKYFNGILDLPTKKSRSQSKWNFLCSCKKCQAEELIDNSTIDSIMEINSQVNDQSQVNNLNNLQEAIQKLDEFWNQLQQQFGTQFPYAVRGMIFFIYYQIGLLLFNHSNELLKEQALNIFKRISTIKLDVEFQYIIQEDICRTAKAIFGSNSPEFDKELGKLENLHHLIFGSEEDLFASVLVQFKL